MKLKKLCCTLVAVAVTSVAFAGNTSELKQLINGYFQPISQQIATMEMYGAMSDSEQEQLTQQKKLLKAVWTGLLNYDEHVTAGTPNKYDEKITQAFTQIPTILNGIKTSSREVEAPLTAALTTLTTNVIANQKQVDVSGVDTSTAVALLRNFAIYKAAQEDALSESVMEILGQEAIEQMMDQMSPEEKEAFEEYLNSLLEEDEE